MEAYSPSNNLFNMKGNLSSCNKKKVMILYVHISFFLEG